MIYMYGIELDSVLEAYVTMGNLIGTCHLMCKEIYITILVTSGRKLYDKTRFTCIHLGAFVGSSYGTSKQSIIHQIDI